jgi:hypothetical protein
MSTTKNFILVIPAVFNGEAGQAGSASQQRSWSSSDFKL